MLVYSSSQTRFNIKFGQVYLTRPNVVENDNSNQPLFPQEAMLRNLTHAAPLMVDIAQEILDGEHDGLGSTRSPGRQQSTARQSQYYPVLQYLAMTDLLRIVACYAPILRLYPSQHRREREL